MNRSDGSVTLREFREEDIERKVRWINDPETHRYLHYDLPLEVEKTRSWFRNKNEETRRDLVIEYEGCPVGVIGLLDINSRDRKAEYYITMGEKTFL